MGCQPLRRQSIAHDGTRHGEHSIGVAARPYVRAQLRASARQGGGRGRINSGGMARARNAGGVLAGRWRPSISRSAWKKGAPVTSRTVLGCEWRAGDLQQTSERDEDAIILNRRRGLELGRGRIGLRPGQGAARN